MIVVSHRRSWYETEKELVMPTVDPNAVILTGENPFIRLSATDGGPNTTEASFWRITFSPGGPGHVLYLKSELTDGQLRIYSDKTLVGFQDRGCADGVPPDFCHALLALHQKCSLRMLFMCKIGL